MLGVDMSSTMVASSVSRNDHAQGWQCSVVPFYGEEDVECIRIDEAVFRGREYLAVVVSHSYYFSCGGVMV